jgi:hypothetical protein
MACPPKKSTVEISVEGLNGKALEEDGGGELYGQQ